MLSKDDLYNGFVFSYRFNFDKELEDRLRLLGFENCLDNPNSLNRNEYEWIFISTNKKYAIITQEAKDTFENEFNITKISINELFKDDFLNVNSAHFI